MSLKVRSAGIWRDSIPYVKAAGTWKIADYVWNKQSGQWYTSFIKGGLIDKSWDSLDQTGQFGTAASSFIYLIAVQSDGKILLGGSFTTWNGTSVGRILRLNSDGTLDTTFTTNTGTGANDYVISIAIQSDGKILVVGGFTSWNGTSVGRILRLNSDGTLDTAFTTNNGAGAAFALNSIAIQSDGKILVGGDSDFWNNTGVGYIVRLNSDGTRDTTFTTNNGTGANNRVYSIAVQFDGKILVGGQYTTWNGTTVGRIVRLDSTGTRDTTFTTNNGTGANSNIYSIAIQSDGKILVGGNFTTWNGTTVGRIVRLDSTGTRDTTFTTNNGTGANSNYVNSIAIQSDGKILLGGAFSTWNGTGVGYIVRLNSDGTNETLSTFANAGIIPVAIQSDGKILVGGNFTTWNGTTVGYIVRLNSDGTRDTTFTTNTGTGANAAIVSIAIQSDGKILVGGNFQTWNGTNVYTIVRLNSDGTRDTTFTTNTGTAASGSAIGSIAIQSDGKILVGGGFTSWNGTTVGYIVRLNSDGTLDTTFTTNTGTGANNSLNSIVVQSDGKILVGGQHTAWNGTTVGRIVRLNSDGTRDTTFTTNNGTGANSTIIPIAVQSDGKIILGGFSFSSWNSTAVGSIVRLNSDGTRDTAFTTNTGTGANSTINGIAIQSDGKILLGGSFTTWNGTTVNRIARLNSDGTLDTAFTSNTGIALNGSVSRIAVQSDGKILLGGFFTTFKTTTQFRRYFVRIGGEIA